MLVAICDDERPFREELRSILFSYKAERRLNIDVYQYPNGEALLASGKDFDMVFLDYQMPGLDGMAVARELRRKSFTCSIIFVTGYTHFVFDAFEVQPYRFLCKPITTRLIGRAVNGIYPAAEASGTAARAGRVRADRCPFPGYSVPGGFRQMLHRAHQKADLHQLQDPDTGTRIVAPALLFPHSQILCGKPVQHPIF